MSHRIRDVLMRRAGWIGVLLTLAAALLVTYGVQTWRLNNVAGHLEAERARAVASVHATIQEDVRHRIRSLRRRAQQLAQQPAVVDGFRAHGTEAPPTALVAFSVQQPPALRAAAEFYAPDRQLVAWSGFNMPLDGGPEIAALDAGTTRVVQDAGVRWALAVWWPVRHEGAVVGAVRAMQLVRFRAPVQNQFIEDYSLERQWRLQTGYPVDVTWGASADTTEGGRLIAGDTVLGRVDVQPPSEAQLLQAERQWFANIAAVWITGLLFGLFAALWVGYRRLGDATPNEGVQPQVVWGFVAVAAAWWGLRYLLIALDVPDRWQTGKAPLAPLFDPTHLASPIGAGVMESTGDLLVTGCFALLFTVGFLDLAARFRVHAGSLSKLWGQIRITTAPKPSLPRFLSIVVVVGVVELGLVHVLASLARRAVLDSTLDFFARTGLLPEPLVLAVLCGLLLITVAVILCGAGVFWIALYALGRYRPSGWRAERLVGIVVLTLAGVLLVAFAGLPQMDIVAVPVVVAYFAAILGVALLGMIQRSGVVRHFTLRSLLPGIIVLTTLLYPMLYQGMDAQRRGRMIDATASFVEGSDPRVIFSLEQVLQRARMSPRAPSCPAGWDCARRRPGRLGRDRIAAGVADRVAQPVRGEPVPPGQHRGVRAGLYHGGAATRPGVDGPGIRGIRDVAGAHCAGGGDRNRSRSHHRPTAAKPISVCRAHGGGRHKRDAGGLDAGARRAAVAAARDRHAVSPRASARRPVWKPLRRPRPCRVSRWHARAKPGRLRAGSTHPGNANRPPGANVAVADRGV